MPLGPCPRAAEAGDRPELWLSGCSMVAASADPTSSGGSSRRKARARAGRRRSVPNTLRAEAERADGSLKGGEGTAIRTGCHGRAGQASLRAQDGPAGRAEPCLFLSGVFLKTVILYRHIKVCSLPFINWWVSSILKIIKKSLHLSLVTQISSILMSPVP